MLRINNGLEFCNVVFNKLCEDSDIARHRTVVNTPQQNGITKRMNRTLLEKVRCMLVSSRLSKPFWGEVVSTAAYLINRSPSSTVSFKTPEQMWSGKAPSLSHLKPFGCAAYAPHQ